MSRLVSFELGVRELGELRRGECRVVEAGIGREGGGELADEVAERGTVETEKTAASGEESQGVPEGCAVGAGPGVPGVPGVPVSPVSPAESSRIVAGSTRQLP